MSKTLLLIALCIIFYLFSPFSRQGGDLISCKADISNHWKDKQLDLLITQNLNNGKGFLSIFGISYVNDKVSSYLSKTISFSYQQDKNYYHLRSELIMNSPQMTMNITDQKNCIPDFFIETDKPLLMKIRPYGNNA